MKTLLQEIVDAGSVAWLLVAGYDIVVGNEHAALMMVMFAILWTCYGLRLRMQNIKILIGLTQVSRDDAGQSGSIGE